MTDGKDRNVDIDRPSMELKAISSAFLIKWQQPQPVRFDALAKLAGTPEERVPALLNVLLQLTKEGFH